MNLFGWNYHLYAPASWGSDWAERLLVIVRPWVVANLEHLDWIWATRYIDDNAGKELPRKYRKGKRRRFISFRYGVRSNHIIEDSLPKTLGRRICYTITDYPAVNDVATPRFTASTDLRDRERRAALILTFMSATLMLTLDMLVRKRGKWVLEESASEENLNLHPLISMHHLWHNSTGLGAPVGFRRRSKLEVDLATPWMTEQVTVTPGKEYKVTWLQY